MKKIMSFILAAAMSFAMTGVLTSCGETGIDFNQYMSFGYTDDPTLYEEEADTVSAEPDETDSAESSDSEEETAPAEEKIFLAASNKLWEETYGFQQTEYKYDDAGNKLECRNLDEDGNTLSTITWSYDNLGRQTSYISRNANDVITSMILHEFDDADQTSEESYYMDEYTVSYMYKYYYNDSGDVVKSEYYSTADDGTMVLDHWAESKYDAAGNEVEYVNYEADGSMSTKVITEYDSLGNETKNMLYFYNDGVEEAKSGEEQEYNEDGILTKRTSYSSYEGSLYVYQVEIYDPLLLITYEPSADPHPALVSTISYNPDGSESARTNCEYDQYGNLTKEEYSFTGDVWTYDYVYDDSGQPAYSQAYYNGELFSSTESTYDEYGNRLSYTTYDAEGNMTGWGESTYVEIQAASGN